MLAQSWTISRTRYTHNRLVGVSSLTRSSLSQLGIETWSPEQNMKSMLVIIFLLITASLSEHTQTIKAIETPVINDSICEGSLVIFDTAGKKQVFNNDENDVRIQVSQVYVELCGCYNIYSRKGFKGTEEFITIGKTLYREDFRLIRSIERTSCTYWCGYYSNSQKYWYIVFKSLFWAY